MKKWLTGAVSLAVLVSGAWLYHWWQSPAQSVVAQTGQEQSDVLGSHNELLPWQTTYFRTNYPVTMRVIRSDEISHGLTKGQYVLAATGQRQADQLAVTVGDTSEEIEQLASVKMRHMYVDEYRPVYPSYLPPGGVAFEKRTGYELAVFWKDGQRFAEVVSSGSPARRAELRGMLETTVTHWQWR